ncbi:MAG: glyoxalase [Gammaproteobacteria bacterium]|nr:MAG: glyoxalase [Gammaproteobacteria bacterium]RKZ69366.1 MAG: glyoxalase [Gammaproteobacteria bacterium]
MNPFHLAIPVSDLEATRVFYVNTLGCEIGRFSDQWIDFNFFGHQVTAHLKPEAVEVVLSNSVDGEDVPVRHFGLVLPWEEWQDLSERLQNLSVDFIIKPTMRFRGQAGEQATMFIKDPGNNALEFKAFKHPSMLFDS